MFQRDVLTQHIKRYDKQCDPTIPIAKRYKTFISFLSTVQTEFQLDFVTQRHQSLFQNLFATVEYLEQTCIKKGLKSVDISTLFETIKLLAVHTPAESLQTELPKLLDIIEHCTTIKAKAAARNDAFRVLLTVINRTTMDHEKSIHLIQQSFNFHVFQSTDQADLPTPNSIPCAKYVVRHNPVEPIETEEMLTDFIKVINGNMDKFQFWFELFRRSVGTVLFHPLCNLRTTITRDPNEKYIGFKTGCPDKLMSRVMRAFVTWIGNDQIKQLFLNNMVNICFTVDCIMNILNWKPLYTSNDAKAVLTQFLTFLQDWMNDINIPDPSKRRFFSLPKESLQSFYLGTITEILCSILQKATNHIPETIFHTTSDLLNLLSACPHKLSPYSRNQFYGKWLYALNEFCKKSLEPLPQVVTSGVFGIQTQTKSILQPTLATAFPNIIGTFMRSFVSFGSDNKQLWERLSTSCTMHYGKQESAVKVWKALLISHAKVAYQIMTDSLTESSAKSIERLRDGVPRCTCKAIHIDPDTETEKKTEGETHAESSTVEPIPETLDVAQTETQPDQPQAEPSTTSVENASAFEKPDEKPNPDPDSKTEEEATEESNPEPAPKHEVVGVHLIPTESGASTPSPRKGLGDDAVTPIAGTPQLNEKGKGCVEPYTNYSFEEEVIFKFMHLLKLFEKDTQFTGLSYHMFIQGVTAVLDLFTKHDEIQQEEKHGRIQGILVGLFNPSTLTFTAPTDKLMTNQISDTVSPSTVIGRTPPKLDMTHSISPNTLFALLPSTLFSACDLPMKDFTQPVSIAVNCILRILERQHPVPLNRRFLGQSVHTLKTVLSSADHTSLSTVLNYTLPHAQNIFLNNVPSILTLAPIFSNTHTLITAMDVPSHIAGSCLFLSYTMALSYFGLEGEKWYQARDQLQTFFSEECESNNLQFVCLGLKGVLLLCLDSILVSHNWQHLQECVGVVIHCVDKEIKDLNLLVLKNCTEIFLILAQYVDLLKPSAGASSIFVPIIKCICSLLYKITLETEIPRSIRSIHIIWLVEALHVWVRSCPELLTKDEMRCVFLAFEAVMTVSKTKSVGSLPPSHKNAAFTIPDSLAAFTDFFQRKDDQKKDETMTVSDVFSPHYFSEALPRSTVDKNTLRMSYTELFGEVKGCSPDLSDNSNLPVEAVGSPAFGTTPTEITHSPLSQPSLVTVAQLQSSPLLENRLSADVEFANRKESFTVKDSNMIRTTYSPSASYHSKSVPLLRPVTAIAKAPLDQLASSLDTSFARFFNRFLDTRQLLSDDIDQATSIVGKIGLLSLMDKGREYNMPGCGWKGVLKMRRRKVEENTEKTGPTNFYDKKHRELHFALGNETIITVVDQPEKEVLTEEDEVYSSSERCRHRTRIIIRDATGRYSWDFSPLLFDSVEEQIERDKRNAELRKTVQETAQTYEIPKSYRDSNVLPSPPGTTSSSPERRRSASMVDGQTPNSSGKVSFSHLSQSMSKTEFDQVMQSDTLPNSVCSLPPLLSQTVTGNRNFEKLLDEKDERSDAFGVLLDASMKEFRGIDVAAPVFGNEDILRAVGESIQTLNDKTENRILTDRQTQSQEENEGDDKEYLPPLFKPAQVPSSRIHPLAFTRSLLVDLGIVNSDMRLSLIQLERTARTESLLSFIDSLPHKQRITVGVVYIGKGQQIESEILTSCSVSVEFVEFLRSLGWERDEEIDPDAEKKVDELEEAWQAKISGKAPQKRVKHRYIFTDTHVEIEFVVPQFTSGKTSEENLEKLNSCNVCLIWTDFLFSFHRSSSLPSLTTPLTLNIHPHSYPATQPSSAPLPSCLYSLTLEYQKRTLESLLYTFHPPTPSSSHKISPDPIDFMPFVDGMLIPPCALPRFTISSIIMAHRAIEMASGRNAAFDCHTKRLIAISKTIDLMALEMSPVVYYTTLFGSDVGVEERA